MSSILEVLPLNSRKVAIMIKLFSLYAGICWRLLCPIIVSGRQVILIEVSCTDLALERVDGITSKQAAFHLQLQAFPLSCTLANRLNIVAESFRIGVIANGPLHESFTNHPLRILAVNAGQAPNGALSRSLPLRFIQDEKHQQYLCIAQILTFHKIVFCHQATASQVSLRLRACPRKQLCNTAVIFFLRDATAKLQLQAPKPLFQSIRAGNTMPLPILVAMSCLSSARIILFTLSGVVLPQLPLQGSDRELCASEALMEERTKDPISWTDALCNTG
mmetsp:Transcript_90037/g.179067  ORF Transcript_90037/g.179067 Transcript_90037/m.179067 type:complete len:276 (+) Transcript_90037:3458-4285(+)